MDKDLLEKLSLCFALALERASQINDIKNKKEVSALVLNTESLLHDYINENGTRTSDEENVQNNKRGSSTKS